MPISQYQKQKNLEREQAALRLYQEGLTLRQVGRAVERSYTWVWMVVQASKKLSTGRGVDKN